MGLPQLHTPCPGSREEGREREVPAMMSLSIRKAENPPQAPEPAMPTLTGQNWIAKETRTDTTDLLQYVYHRGQAYCHSKKDPGSVRQEEGEQT